MRSLLLVVATALPVPAAQAQEPLFLHIRPNDSPSEAAAARARHEAVWMRSDARARIAIASVCTGCMKPMLPAPVVPPCRHDTTEIASDSDAANVYAPPSALLATAGEP